MYALYISYVTILEIKRRGSPEAKNANDPSPFAATLDSISAAGAVTSARGPSRARANGERRTAAFVPRLPAMDPPGIPPKP